MTARSVAVSLLAIAAFFPYVGLVPGVDVQPNFALISALFCLLFGLHIKVKPLALGLALVYIALCMARVAINVEQVPFAYMVSFVSATVTPVLVWYVVKSKIVDIDTKTLSVVILVYLLVGAIQLLYGQDFLSFLVQRDNVDLLIESKRGVRSLTPEPSNFGRVLLVLNVLYVFLALHYIKRNVIFNCLLVSVCLLVCNYILSKSVYAVAFHALFFLWLALCLKFRVALLILGISVVIFPAIISIFIFGNEENSRFAFILSALLSDFSVIVQQGAFARVMNVPISLYGGLVHGPFGAGLGMDKVSGSFDVFGYTYHFNVGSRNLGGFVEYFLRLGVLSLPFYVFYFWVLWRVSSYKLMVNGLNYKVGLLFAFSLILISFFDGSPSNPLVWVTLFFVYNFAVERVKEAGNSGLYHVGWK